MPTPLPAPVYLTALLILGAFGMQKMVDHVAQRSFPALERRRGGSLAGSVWNGVAALGGMAALFLISLPLWLLPPLWPLIPLAIFAWTNQRLLRYDAVSEHADRAEMAQLFRERGGALLMLGLLFALLYLHASAARRQWVTMLPSKAEGRSICVKATLRTSTPFKWFGYAISVVAEPQFRGFPS